MKKKTVKLVVKCCADCPHAECMPDPDPNDWFRDGDYKMNCRKTKRKDKTIRGGIEPFDDVKKFPIPKWCPLG